MVSSSVIIRRFSSFLPSALLVQLKDPVIKDFPSIMANLLCMTPPPRPFFRTTSKPFFCRKTNTGSPEDCQLSKTSRISTPARFLAKRASAIFWLEKLNIAIWMLIWERSMAEISPRSVSPLGEKDTRGKSPPLKLNREASAGGPGVKTGAPRGAETWVAFSHNQAQ